MNPPESKRELRELFSRICDGIATEEECAWTNAAVVNDQRVRCLYWEYMSAEASIESLARAKSEGKVNAHLVDLDSVLGDLNDTSKKGIPTVTMLDWNQHPVRFLLVSGLLTLVAWAIGWWVFWPDDQGQVAGFGEPSSSSVDELGPSLNESSQLFVATLNRNYDSQWGNNSLPISEGARLEVGQELQLSSGYAVVEYINGVKVVLEGPSSYMITGENAGKLNAGKLTARVGKNGKGFTVATPHSTIRDLGTEFGIHVDEDGTGCVHVFEGEVELLVKASAANEVQRITTGVSFSLAGEKITGFDPNEFKRAQSLQPRSFALGIFDDVVDERDNSLTIVKTVTHNDVVADLTFEFSTDTGTLHYGKGRQIVGIDSPRNQGRTGSTSIDPGETLTLSVTAVATKIPLGKKITAMNFGISRIDMMCPVRSKGTISYTWKSSARDFTSSFSPKSPKQEKMITDRNSTFDINRAQYKATFNVGRNQGGVRLLTHPGTITFNFQAETE